MPLPPHSHNIHNATQQMRYTYATYLQYVYHTYTPHATLTAYVTHTFYGTYAIILGAQSILIMGIDPKDTKIIRVEQNQKSFIKCRHDILSYLK